METILALDNLVIARNFCIATKNTSGDHIWMNIHQKIKSRREALGLSMEQMAKLCDVKSWQTVQQWEKNTAPKRTRLAKVAEVLKVTPEWLIITDDALPEVGNLDEQKKRERRLIELYRELPAEGHESQSWLLNFAELWVYMQNRREAPPVDIQKRKPRRRGNA